MNSYSIQNILNYRNIDWNFSEDFLYLTEVSEIFEPFTFNPNYFSYGLINSGNMLIEVDHTKYQIDPSSLILHRPDQAVKILSIAPETKGAFVFFTRNFIDQLFERFFTISPKSFLHNQFGSYVTLSGSDHRKMASLFNKIIDFLEESSGSANRWEYSAKNMLLALINETDSILDKYKSETYEFSPRAGKIADKFKKLIALNYATQRNIHFYAAELNVSTNYLHKIIKKQCNQTPADMIHETTVSQCKSFLCYSDFTIGEIADNLSFGSIQSFSKYFKKHTGQSPSQFKANHLRSTNG